MPKTHQHKLFVPSRWNCPTRYPKRGDKQTGKVQSSARPKPYAVRIPGSESKIKIKNKLPLQHTPTFQAIWRNSARAVERSAKSQSLEIGPKYRASWSNCLRSPGFLGILEMSQPTPHRSCQK